MLSKERMKEYMKERRESFAKRGLCPDCGTQRNDLRYKRCSACREKIRIRQRNYERRKNNDQHL